MYNTYEVNAAFFYFLGRGGEAREIEAGRGTGENAILLF